MSEFSAERAPPYPEMIQLFPGVIEQILHRVCQWALLHDHLPQLFGEPLIRNTPQILESFNHIRQILFGP